MMMTRLHKRTIRQRVVNNAPRWLRTEECRHSGTEIKVATAREIDHMQPARGSQFLRVSRLSRELRM